MSFDESAAISVRGLGKVYTINPGQRGQTSLRESFMQRLRDPFARAPRENFWALEDVSFDVQPGECVGIIGRNGAGKSTLLKILSRITAPSVGRAQITGRVGSLLEVGTGFHPELTGRENVFLNGAILGMRRGEIRRRFESIVDFAGVEQFIDTPVKRYSSGMYVRLAFAVAAHLESEVLIVDEVLAVGDLEFQRKCLGKMQDVASSGRTVLFVSHNMSAVQRLCKRGVLLRRGKVAAAGEIDDVVSEYLSYLRDSAATAFSEDNPERLGSGAVRVTTARILDELGHPTRHLRAGRPATFEFHYRNPASARSANIFMTLYNQLGVACTQFDLSLSHCGSAQLSDQGVFRCQVPSVPFPIGDYRVAMAVDVDGEHADLVPNALAFTVETSTFYPTPRTPSTTYCAVMVEHQWEHDAGAAAPIGSDNTAATSAAAISATAISATVAASRAEHHADPG